MTSQVSKQFLHPSDISLKFFFFLTEYPAGEVIKCLVGLGNNGKNDFIVQLVEASLR